MEDSPDVITVSVHLHLTKQAFDLLEKYASKRKRGEFISDLIVAHHLSEKRSSGDAVEMLGRQAAAAQTEATRLMHAYNKAREIYTAGKNGNQKKR